MGHMIPPFSAATDRGYKFLCTFQIVGMPRGDKRVVWIEGGVPPYDWSISGTAFTLDDATTTEQYNFVTAANDAATDSQETLTIVDDEGTSVTCGVKLTDYTDTGCCGGGGAGTPHLDPCCDDPAVAPTIGSADTPAAGKWCKVYLENGCSPFTWDIAEAMADYLTLRYPVTNIPENEVYVAVGAPVGDIDLETHVLVGDDCLSLCCINADTLERDDANSDDTIVTGGAAAEIAVLGGCGDFSWALSDIVNYHLAETTTTGRSNTVTSTGNGSSCRVKVTVTDACDTVLEFYIRNTAGRWCSDWGVDVNRVLWNDPCAPMASYSYCNYLLGCTWAGGAILDFIEGAERWLQGEGADCAYASPANTPYQWCDNDTGLPSAHPPPISVYDERLYHAAPGNPGCYTSIPDHYCYCARYNFSYYYWCC